MLKCHLKGKASRKLSNGQNIDYSEKKRRKWPKGFICPCTGFNTIIFKHVYWYMQQISGERLQDHWSSCSLLCTFAFRVPILNNLGWHLSMHSRQSLLQIIKSTSDYQTCTVFIIFTSSPTFTLQFAFFIVLTLILSIK